MKVELLVSEWCPTCPQAEKVWSAIAAEREFEFAVIDLAQPEGRALAQRLRVRTIPATVIDGELRSVGVPGPAEARQMVAAAPPRRRASARHAGMFLSTDNRWFISTAMLYFIASGFWLAWHGGIVVDGNLRGVGLHLFGAGFVQSLIYGLGAHMLPRFTGNPVHAGALSWTQYASHNAGVLMLVAAIPAMKTPVMIAGAVLMWLALAIYAWRIWPVLWPPVANGDTLLTDGERQ